MSRLRVWCAGASVGYLVGWLAGSNVQRLAEGRCLAADYRRNEGAPVSAERRARLMAYTPARTAGRPSEPRSGVPAPRETPEPGTAPQIGAQRIAAYNPALIADNLRAFEEFAAPIPAQRDDEPCTTRSPGGGLTCSRKGSHTAHVFLGAHSRDRKDDTDEGIE